MGGSGGRAGGGGRKAPPLFPDEGASDDQGDAESLAQRLQSSASWGGGRFPLTGGPAGGILSRAAANGEVTNYAEYDGSGNILKRVDLSGRSHAGIDTPHTLDYVHDTNPLGQVFPRGLPVRPANPSEVP